jgi:hypothetical protein
VRTEHEEEAHMQDKKSIEKEDRLCAFCEKGTPVPGGEFVICPKKGLVDEKFSCRSFSYDPLKREPKRKETDAFCEFVDIDDET